MKSFIILTVLVCLTSLTVNADPGSRTPAQATHTQNAPNCPKASPSTFTIAADFGSTDEFMSQFRDYVHELSSIEGNLNQRIDQLNFDAFKQARDLNSWEKAKRQALRDAIAECEDQVTIVSERASKLYWEVLAHQNR